MRTILVFLALALSGAAAWGTCSDAYCSSCPRGPKLCERCSGNGLPVGDSPNLAVGRFYADPKDGRCHMCQDKTPECAECDGRTGACRSCNYGFGLKGGACVPCSDPDCASCTSNADKCSYCSTGGVEPATGKCLRCAAGCAPGSCGRNKAACDKCQPGWRKAGKGCSRRVVRAAKMF
ncbi:hypothetical protein ABPG77_006157 [Micractinium sp. CCAP 211/92]